MDGQEIGGMTHDPRGHIEFGSILKKTAVAIDKAVPSVNVKIGNFGDDPRNILNRLAFMTIQIEQPKTVRDNYRGEIINAVGKVIDSLKL
ncbi:hypothetical protein ACFLQ6_09590 [Thermoproteota archaeon]